MRRVLPMLLITRMAVGSLLVIAIACSPGGGSGMPTPVPVAAPQALTYATNPAVYTKGVAVSANAPDIWINHYTAGSGWGTTANLGQVRINIPGGAGAPAGWPQVAMDANGNALVVWTQPSPSDGGATQSLWSNRYH